MEGAGREGQKKILFCAVDGGGAETDKEDREGKRRGDKHGDGE